MRQKLFLVFFGLINFSTIAQVGIGTTTPSDAAMLDISSSSDGGMTFHGLLPPKVPSQTERDLINSDSLDVGLLIFVESTATFEIWNGVFWEVIYTLISNTVNLAVQDFDTNINWNFSLSPAPYINSGPIDYWSVLNSLGSGTAAIDLVSGDYLGCRDLNNPNGGGNFYHEIIFVNVDVSSLTNPRLAFDYDVFEFDNGDDVRYEIFYDDVGQGQVVLINGAANYSEQGTVLINIPITATNVRLTLGIIQNGNDDFAGFDNFRIYGL